MLSLSPEYVADQGTLAGGSSLYYAVSAVDGAGNEGALSFTVFASIPSVSNTNSVTITGLSLPATAQSFNVYRGTSPQMLYRIASGVAIDPNNPTYTDSGAPPQPFGPPDASFDHANFYYRYEYAGPFLCTSFSSTSIACADMGATSQAFTGMVVRIIEGTGRGQERSISTNDQTTITVASAWSVMPDTTSQFVVAQASWTFAAVSATSPAQFEIPYRSGTVIQISGRGANVNNQEGTPDLCPLTRCALGQQQTDGGVPGVPGFILTPSGEGELSITQIGFVDYSNTASISSGTLQLFYWSELDTPSTFALSASVDNQTTTIPLVSIPTTLPIEQSSGIVQIGSELMSILSADATANTYSVVRGVLGSAASAHNSADLVLHLGTSVIITPFASNFFANQASLDYLHTVSLPDVRISAAEFFVTNAFGDSQTNQLCYTSTLDRGLRTLSGGQFSLQISGYIATQQNATPPLLIEAAHAVLDIRANVSQAATGYDISVDVLQNGSEYCNVTIPSGSNSSPIQSGTGLPPLTKESIVTVNVTLQVDNTFTGSPTPGRDLTVTIRL